MDTPPSPDRSLPVKEVSFSNGNRAHLVAPPAGSDAAGILQALGIQPPTPLIIISGGAGDMTEAMAADAKLEPRLTQLFSRGIARAAADVKAVILDGGTEAGVMQLMGQGVVGQGRGVPLVGVAPAGQVTYPGGPPEGGTSGSAPLDPNHSHFVLVDSRTFGGETDTMFSLAKALVSQPAAQAADGASPAVKPATTVLVNGDPGKDSVSKAEVLHSVRHGWPVVVVEGSGGLADEIATLLKEPPAFIQDPALAEIIADGDLHLFGPDGSAAALRKLITRQVGRDKSRELA